MSKYQASARRSRCLRWRLLPVGPVAIVLALALAGCAGPAGDSDDGDLAGGSGTEDEVRAPVLQIVRAGGFVPMGYDFSRVPELTVYGDGRAISHGPQILIYPGPVLPNLLLSTLTAEDVETMVESAREAGLLGDVPEYGQPPVADAPTTTVTLTVDGVTYVHAANALGFGDGTGNEGLPPGDGVDADDGLPGPSEDERAARVALSEFVAGAQERVDTAGEAEPYVITAFGVFARTAFQATAPDHTADEPEIAGEPGFERQVLTWPLDVALAAAEQCLFVDGADAEALRVTLLRANVATLFEQDGVRFDAFFRPLLPHEDGCDDLL